MKYYSLNEASKGLCLVCDGEGGRSEGLRLSAQDSQKIIDLTPIALTIDIHIYSFFFITSHRLRYRTTEAYQPICSQDMPLCDGEFLPNSTGLITVLTINPLHYIVQT